MDHWVAGCHYDPAHAVVFDSGMMHLIEMWWHLLSSSSSPVWQELRHDCVCHGFPPILLTVCSENLWRTDWDLHLAQLFAHSSGPVWLLLVRCCAREACTCRPKWLTDMKSAVAELSLYCLFTVYDCVCNYEWYCQVVALSISVLFSVKVYWYNQL